MTHDVDSMADNPLILQAAREYLSLLEGGAPLDRRVFLERYPDLADQLNECFDGIEWAHALKPKGTAPYQDSAFQAGAPLGDFQIIREIARGGMGVVYEANQLSLGRRVALKVLPFAAALDERQLQRFKIEAQAAAQLHHTNIVPVYAVGCDRGVHYYAMQLIDGQSLADVLNAWRNAETAAKANHPAPASVATATPETLTMSRSTTTATRKSQWRCAAQWIAEVADALEFAHAAGVIHRDIKPANILVNDKGRVWVTDFGLAQVAADVSLTRSGELLGTLRYMSPEQVLGQRTLVDHRADIYSLGATLYELLTLTPIFPAEDRAPLLRQILHEDPKPPRQLNRAIPVELETIVWKALAKAANERYATAGEMAEDLRRFLSEKPIRARRPTLVDRGRKWLRRHPAYAVAGSLLLLFVTIGSSIATAVVWNQQQLTRQSLERERERAHEAESRFEMARRMADELIQLAEDESLDEPFQEGLRTRLLETALHYYQEFIEERQDRPQDQAELQATRDRVQKILADLALLRTDRQFFLLRDPRVLEDLQVTAEQRGQLVQVLGHLPPFMGRGHAARQESPPAVGGYPDPPLRPPPFISREELVEIAREHEEQLTRILKESQLSRLQQIAIQFQGVDAFRDFSIIKQLGLTKEQQERIRQIQFEWYAVGRHDRGAYPRRPRTEARQGAMRQIVNEVFTEEQRQRWQLMIGRSFNFSESIETRLP